MIVTYQSPKYAPQLVRARYVRACLHGEASQWRWCEVGENPAFDLRQGSAETSEIPQDVRQKAEKQRGRAWSYVDWPIESEVAA